MNRFNFLGIRALGQISFVAIFALSFSVSAKPAGRDKPTTSSKAAKKAVAAEKKEDQTKGRSINSRTPGAGKKVAFFYFLGGGPVNAWSLGTAEELVQHFADIAKKEGYDVSSNGIHFTSGDTICEEVPKVSDRGPVVVVGHSWGGHKAILVSRCLAKKNIKIDLLISIDPIRILGRLGNMSEIPPNVAQNYNLYTPSTFSILGHGTKNKAKKVKNPSKASQPKLADAQVEAGTESQESIVPEGSPSYVHNIRVHTSLGDAHTRIDDDTTPLMKGLLELTFGDHLGNANIPAKIRHEDIKNPETLKSWLRN